MAKRKKKSTSVAARPKLGGYDAFLGGVTELLDAARRMSARSVNVIMTLTYWEVGRRLVEFEQQGKKRADYGTALLKTLSTDLTSSFGRGFSVDNLENMRRFYLTYQHGPKSETPSRNIAIEKSETLSRIFPEAMLICLRAP